LPALMSPRCSIALMVLRFAALSIRGFIRPLWMLNVDARSTVPIRAVASALRFGFGCTGDA
jgi:hypothetical protein